MKMTTKLSPILVAAVLGAIWGALAGLFLWSPFDPYSGTGIPFFFTVAIPLIYVAGPLVEAEGTLAITGVWAVTILIGALEGILVWWILRTARVLVGVK